jgi:hypothetical protein
MRKYKSIIVGSQEEYDELKSSREDQQTRREEKARTGMYSTEG